MIWMRVDSGCYWTLSSGAVTLLDRLPPGDYDTANSNPNAISDDGSVIVGSAISARVGSTDTTTYPVRWDHGVITQLPALSYLGQPLAPGKCSSDASVMMSNAGYWTVGGTTGTLLSPVANGTIPQAVDCSSDGHVFVGNSICAQGTRWLDGVPTAVTGHYRSSLVNLCSADGNTLVGRGDGSLIKEQGFWLAPGLDYHPANIFQFIRQANADGSVIWSDDIDLSSGYTDDLGTSSAGIYGTLYTADDVSGYRFRNNGFAIDTFSPNPISVGSTHDPSFAFATKTTGTSTVLLSSGSYISSEAGAVSGNGQIIAGVASSGDYITPAGSEVPLNTPVWWDAAGTMHVLSIPDGWNVASVNGISRDGTIAFGMVYKFISKPDPPIALRLVSLYPQDLPDNSYHIFTSTSAEFPESFGQYSVSMWCCENVTLQWPRSDTAFGLLEVSPSGCHVEFRDVSGVLLFSGNFVNPNSDPPNLYKFSFAIDTEIGVVTCFGDNVEWTSTDANFASAGQIGNALTV